ncbi:MAG: serine/threonine-protein kinase [Planctomycetota bacterium]
MDAERWQQVERLFNAALDADDRSAFLSAHAPSEEVRGRVEAMLAAEAMDQTSLDTGIPAQDALRAIRAHNERAFPAIGDRVGAYRISRLIAAGGMGAVFLAARVDSEITQTVAIKFLRHLAFASERGEQEALRRFRNERQVLASLEHPGITRLLDAGATATGQPYFVMEHVEGIPIDTYCTSNHLSVRQRVTLMVDVCDAVQHAHHMLVVHRDIKPQNILVTHEGRPKVLDFGIARLMEPELLEGAATRTGEFVGTLAYASPEQLRGERGFDTRSDVYSLGVVLYALLTGRLPHDTTRSLPAIVEAVERERPDAPSTLNPRVSQDLDAVVLQAISKSRDRRYQSASELADDLRRALHGEPVNARSDSRWYVVRSELWRRRVPVAIALAIIVVSVAFGTFATVQQMRLQDRTEQLAESLYVDTVQRGRLLGRTGNLIGAEEALRDAVDMGVRDDPSLADWALRELYGTTPLIASVRLPKARWTAVAALPDGALLARDEDGRVVEVTPDGVIIDAFEARAIASGEDQRVAWVDVKGVIWVRAGDGAPARWSQGHEDASVIAVTADHVAAFDGHSGVAVAEEGDPVALQLPRDVTQLRVCGARHEVFGLGSDGMVRAWSVLDGAQTGAWSVGADARCLAVSRDGRSIVSANGRTVQCIDRDTGVTHRFNAANGWVIDVAILGSSDPTIATISADYALRIWRMDSMQPIFETTAHGTKPSWLAWNAESGSLFSIDEAGLVRVWDLEDGIALPRRIAVGTGTVHGLDVGPDWVAASMDAEPDRLVLHHRSDARWHAVDLDAPVSSVAAVGDDGWIATTYAGTLLRVSLDGTAALREEWRRDLQARANSIAWMPEEGCAAVACDDATIRVHQASDGSEVRRIDLDAIRVPAVAWSPADASLFAVTYPESDLVAIDVATGATRTLFDGTRSDGLRCVEVAPRGDTLAFAGDDARVHVWRWTRQQGWRPSSTLSGHREGIFALAFSPDGSTLASSGRRGTTLLWHVGLSTELTRFTDHSSMVFALAFDPDGSSLYSGGIGGEVMVRSVGGPRLSREGDASPPVMRDSVAPE